MTRGFAHSGVVFQRGFVLTSRPSLATLLNGDHAAAQGLLTEYGNRLANLTHLDVGACTYGGGAL